MYTAFLLQCSLCQLACSLEVPLLLCEGGYQLARESGDYEGLIDNLTGNEQFFQEEVCRWFGKEYNPEMVYGLSKEEIKEKIIQKLCSCVEEAKENSPFNVKKCEELWQSLRDIIWPNKRLLSDNGNNSISTKYKPEAINEEKKYNRLVGDINRMLEFCKLPYEVSKVNGKHGVPSEWTYKIDETSITDEEQVDASAESEQE